MDARSIMNDVARLRLASTLRQRQRMKAYSIATPPEQKTCCWGIHLVSVQQRSQPELEKAARSQGNTSPAFKWIAKQHSSASSRRSALGRVPGIDNSNDSFAAAARSPGCLCEIRLAYEKRSRSVVHRRSIIPSDAVSSWRDMFRAPAVDARIQKSRTAAGML
jgi:hypothetical protein